MKSKKDDYVNEEQKQNVDKQQSENLTIEEQLELFAEILIDQLLNDKQENEN